MTWRRPGNKPLSEPMPVSLPTHICVTWPQWDKNRPSLSLSPQLGLKVLLSLWSNLNASNLSETISRCWLGIADSPTLLSHCNILFKQNRGDCWPWVKCDWEISELYNKTVLKATNLSIKVENSCDIDSIWHKLLTKFSKKMIVRSIFGVSW